jgi:hypothetical protein
VVIREHEQAFAGGRCRRRRHVRNRLHHVRSA